MEIINFSCPNCGSDNPFLYEKGNEFIRCKKCESKFLFKNKIIRFSSYENYAESFGFQWNIFRKTQLDSFVNKSISRDRLYEATGWNTNLKGQNILEAGSGAGRFTEILVKTEANIFTFDYSNAVEANYLNNGDSNNLKIFQGDINKIPFPNETFDHILCLGVLQHTPNPEKSFNSLVSKLKKGGYLYIDIYSNSFIHKIQWKYILRPVTKRIPKKTLFYIVKNLVPFLILPTILLKRLLGSFGARLSPIKEFSELNLGKIHNKNWAILDTFDMYSPEHDHPKRKKDVEKWFLKQGFTEFNVFYGKNGIVARGKKN